MFLPQALEALRRDVRAFARSVFSGTGHTQTIAWRSPAVKRRLPLRTQVRSRYDVFVTTQDDDKSVEDQADKPAEQAPPPTPFDHPLFLPALLLAGMLWFGYDGWINPAFQEGGESHDSLDFNRYGFAVLGVLTAWFGFKGWKEFQADKKSDPPSPESP